MSPPKKHEHGNNYLQRGRAKAEPKMTPARVGLVGGSDVTSEVSPLTGEAIGQEAEVYHGLKDRMPVMPVSIWEFPMDRWNKLFRKMVGDTGQLRADSFMGGSFLPSENGARANAASIFNPMLAGSIIQAYSKVDDMVIDPFAGGGTRAVMAGALGRDYLGVDVRADEVARVNDRLRELDLIGRSQVITGDAAKTDWTQFPRADLLLTCPPYWNLEVYSDDPDDLSTRATYPSFMEGIEEVISRTAEGMANGGLSVWVVGEFRDPETTQLIDFPGDVARLHQKHSFWLYDRFIYTHKNPQAFWRMGVFDKTRKLIRVHEHVLVMKYGGLRKVSPKKRTKTATGDGLWGPE